MGFKFKVGDLVLVNFKYGVFQVVKPIKFKDENYENCLKYYIRPVFDKNDNLNIKPAILCHESWMDLLSPKSKIYKIIQDKLNLPEIKNIVFEPSMEYRYFTKFKDSAFITCSNITYKEIAKRFEEISGKVIHIDKILEILNEFYKHKKIKTFNILKPQEYTLEKDDNVYLITVGRFVNDFKQPDEINTLFYRNVKISKKAIKEINKKTD